MSNYSDTNLVGFEALKANGLLKIEYAINQFGQLCYPEAYSIIV